MARRTASAKPPRANETDRRASAAPQAAQSDPTASEVALRAAVLATARTMSARGLSPGRSGNVSARFADGMLITPSGLPYDETTVADIVQVDGLGRVANGQRKPSSEWQFHLAAYRARPDRHAVLHSHSMHATVLACAHKPIPAFHYMVAVAGGSDVPLVPYATFGTDELAAHVAHGLTNRDACLMANHGQIAIGATLSAALELASEIETLAEQYIKVLALGAVHLLPADEMTRVLDRFRSYGQRAQG
jgi:L-fuculose-phosphate aldolase